MKIFKLILLILMLNNLSGCGFSFKKKQNLDFVYTNIGYANILTNEKAINTSNKNIFNFKIRFPLNPDFNNQLSAVNFVLEVLDYKFLENRSVVKLSELPLNPFWQRNEVMSIKESLLFLVESKQSLIIDHKNKIITIWDNDYYQNLKTLSVNNTNKTMRNDSYTLVKSNHTITKVSIPIDEHENFDKRVVLNKSQEEIETKEVVLRTFKTITNSTLLFTLSSWVGSEVKVIFRDIQWMSNIVIKDSDVFSTDLEKSIDGLLGKLNSNNELIKRNIELKYKLNNKVLEIYRD